MGASQLALNSFGKDYFREKSGKDFLQANLENRSKG